MGSSNSTNLILCSQDFYSIRALLAVSRVRCNHDSLVIYHEPVKIQNSIFLLPCLFSAYREVSLWILVSLCMFTYCLWTCRMKSLDCFGQNSVWKCPPQNIPSQMNQILKRALILYRTAGPLSQTIHMKSLLARGTFSLFLLELILGSLIDIKTSGEQDRAHPCSNS